MSTFSTNKNYELMVTGDPATSGVWGNTTNTNLSNIDTNLGGVLSLSGLTNVNQVLTTTQAQNLVYVLTGALTANISITWPTTGGRGFFIVNNQTTNPFTIALISTGGGIISTAQQGGVTMVYNDGVNMVTTSAPSTSILPVGLITDFGGTTPPARWLMCDGSSYLRSTQSLLFGVIGVTWGSADASHFNVPDLRCAVTAGYDLARATGGGIRNVLTGAYAGGVNAQTFTAFGGQEAHAVVPVEMASHNHGMAHTHNGQVGSDNFWMKAASGGGSAMPAGTGSIQRSTTGPSSVTQTDGGAGLGGATGYPHNTVQPTTIVSKIIYAGQ